MFLWQKNKEEIKEEKEEIYYRAGIIKYCREKSENGRKNFEHKHRLIWEQAHGEIPKGYIITFLDGNPQNCVLENLAMISQAENLQLQRASLRKENPQLTETGILIARAYVTAKKKSKKENKNGRT